MSFYPKISHPIGGKLVQGGLPTAILNTLQFNSITNEWEFVAGAPPLSLSRHRVITNKTIELQPNRIFPISSVTLVSNNQFEEHSMFLDLDTDFFEEFMFSGLVDESITALTVNKADGTNLQAPANSELVIFLLASRGLNGAAGDNSNFRVRGTVLPDDPGSSADDLTNQFNISRNLSRNLTSPIILPANRFLTLVFVSTGVGIVDGRIQNVFAIGTEAFP